ncbi:MAG TPA: hypothetical protein ENJ38_11330 [Rhodospirillales bacterium]|nr:hypothetical protein [Rhodospirillales bacterium]
MTEGRGEAHDGTDGVTVQFHIVPPSPTPAPAGPTHYHRGNGDMIDAVIEPWHRLALARYHAGGLRLLLMWIRYGLAHGEQTLDAAWQRGAMDLSNWPGLDAIDKRLELNESEIGQHALAAGPPVEGDLLRTARMLGTVTGMPAWLAVEKILDFCRNEFDEKWLLLRTS